MLEEIAKYFRVFNFEKGYSEIISLLKKHQKSDYFFIITNLAKISILEKDLTFKRVFDELEAILKPNYKFNVRAYDESIHYCILNNDDEKLQYYLTILNQAKTLDLDDDTKYELYDHLEEIEILTENRQNSPKVDSMREYLRLKRDELIDNISDNNKKGGIVLLDEMPSEQRGLLYQLSREYSDIYAFSIGPENENDIKPVVIRYRAPIYKRIDFSKGIKAADTSFRNRDYEGCIDRNLEMLSYGKPNQYLYASIGLAYLKLKDYGNALLYLFVAYNIINEQVNNKYIAKRYRRLIDSLRLMDNSVDYDLEASELFNLKSQRKLHRTVIEEACNIVGIDYVRFMTGLDYAKIEVNKGLLSNVAESAPEVFKELVLISMDALRCQEKNTPYLMEEAHATIIKNGEIRISMRALIKDIQKKLDYSDSKPVFKVDEEEFSTTREIDDFGFNKFDLVDMYVNEYGMTIREAAEKIGLTSEELSIVRLIYAKEYYTQSFFEKGDEFVRCVEQTKDKTPVVKGILTEVKTNKLFYKNRPKKGKQRVLTLKINPKK